MAVLAVSIRLSQREPDGKLAALRDSGAITGEEFAAYKANLLP
jgi:hypothetical protein